MPVQGAILYDWSIHLIEGGDLRQNVAHCRRSIAIAEQLGDQAAIEQRQTVLSTLLQMLAAPSSDPD